MSAQEFKPGDRARCIETWTTHVIDSGDEFTVEDVDPTTRNGLEVFVQGEWVPARYFEKVKPQFFVGQRVSGDDYKRLPVGAVVADPTGVATKVAENVWRWDDGAEDADEEVRMERTLTHLPDELADWERELLAEVDAEDKDDLYVEPEPLKESPRDVYPARPVRLTDRLGAILFDGMATVEWTSTGAIGTITPVKPAQCTSLYEQGHYLVRCTALGPHEGHRDGLAETWTDAEEYGHVEVSS